MSVIGRPEILRVRHQGCEIAFHSRKIELLEFSTIVEIRRHGIGSVVVLAKDLEADRFGPPILIGSTITRVQIGALGCTHDYLFNVFSSWVKFSPRFYFMSFAVFRHDFTFLNSHSCFLTHSLVTSPMRTVSLSCRVLVFSSHCDCPSGHMASIWPLPTATCHHIHSFSLAR